MVRYIIPKNNPRFIAPFTRRTAGIWATRMDRVEISRILPALANEFVTIIKESSITYVIGVQEIMSAANSVKGATYRALEALVVAAGLYFCLCFPTSKIIAHFERKMSRGYKR